MINKLRCFYLLRRTGMKPPFFKTLRKKFLKPVRVCIGSKLAGTLVASYDYAEGNVIFIEAVWYKKTLFTAIKRDLFKVLFDTFILAYTGTFKAKTINKLIIVVKLNPFMEVEDFFALDLHGFHPDPSATIDILDFDKPWREKEDLTYLVYSRGI